MKRFYLISVVTLCFVLLLSSCGSGAKITKGTYSLNGDSTQPSIVIVDKETLKFVNFGENFFLETFKIPGPEDEQYDEENYALVQSIGQGSTISYTVEKNDSGVFIKTKIGDFIEIRLPYSKSDKTIKFKNENYTLVK